MPARSASDPRPFCLRCMKRCIDDPSAHECHFDRSGSTKCRYCRSQKSQCVPIPARYKPLVDRVVRYFRLLRAPRVSTARRERLEGHIMDLATRIKNSSLLLGRLERKPKSNDAVFRLLLAEQRTTNLRLKEMIRLLKITAHQPEDDDEDDEEEDLQLGDDEEDSEASESETEGGGDAGNVEAPPGGEAGDA